MPRLGPRGKAGELSASKEEAALLVRLREGPVPMEGFLWCGRAQAGGHCV